jgi:hypothetical protein
VKKRENIKKSDNLLKFLKNYENLENKIITPKLSLQDFY